MVILIIQIRQSEDGKITVRKVDIESDTGEDSGGTGKVNSESRFKRR